MRGKCRLPCHMQELEISTFYFYECMFDCTCCICTIISIPEMTGITIFIVFDKFSGVYWFSWIFFFFTGDILHTFANVTLDKVGMPENYIPFQYMLELALIETETLKYLPSELASAAFYLTFEIKDVFLCEKKFQGITNYTLQTLRDPIAHLQHILSLSFKHPQMQVIRNKYSLPKYAISAWSPSPAYILQDA